MHHHLQRQQQRRRQRQQHRFISRKMMNVLSFILPLIMRSFDKLIDVVGVVAALLATHLHIEGQSQQQQQQQQQQTQQQ